MDVPSREEIRELCTAKSFRRGQNYYHEGRIRQLTVDEGSVRATVRGTYDYTVTADLTGNHLTTSCSCPYDYAGDCKHIVAVLLAVHEEEVPEVERSGPATEDVAELVERTPPDDLVRFLLEELEADRELRDRFVAFAGGEVDTSVQDYKRKLDREFDRAAGPGGLVEYGSWIDFSTYTDQAEAFRAGGNYEQAAAVYRAVAEAVEENLDRVDDSSGHYGQTLSDAIESYAECLDEASLDETDRQDRIDYLLERYLDPAFDFVSEYYERALETLCSSRAELAYWRDGLAPYVETRTGVDVTDPGSPAPDASAETPRDATAGDEPPEETAAPADAAPGAESADAAPGAEPADADSGDVPSDVPSIPVDELTSGPLAVDEFTGGCFEVDHLGVGGLAVDQFVGDAFEGVLRVTDPEEPRPGLAASSSHSTDSGSTSADSQSGSSPAPSGSPSADPVSPDRTAAVSDRTLLSTTVSLLEELDDREALLALLDAVYLESSGFCLQYVDGLLDEGREDRALAVLEEGVERFDRNASVRRRLADIYRGRDPDRYRETLTELVVDHRDWEAYDELREACPADEWERIRERIVSRIEESSERALIRLYLHEGERALNRVLERGHLRELKEYCERLGDIDPEAYFETYRAQLVPFLADDTGRSHYRTVIGHLNRLQTLGLDDRFEALLEFLKDEHSNRPAFLDELDQAGL